MTAATENFGLDLLAFGAHPDDVEICCGGLLALSAARGHRTGIVDLSRGELSTSGTPELRAQETAAASQILGLAVRENLGFPDGFINPYAGYDDEPTQRAHTTQVARVVSVLRRLRPAIVVMPWTHERHPDHEATAALVTKALFFANVRKFATADQPALPPFSPREVLRYPMRYDFGTPSFVVDISPVVERKAAAIAAYASQLGQRAPVAPAPSPASSASPLIASPLTVEAFAARDRYHGAMIGVTAGEPYLTRNVLGLADPVAHFRDNRFGNPLFFGPPK
ncbi:MAG TPA: bacillithiol biosynthesis deacetylase BshB1 [Polyangia bacterium]